MNVANPARNDPFKNFNFLVEIDGITQAGFSECTGLRLEIDVIEYREGGETSSVRKLPGRAKVGDITLKRGITTSKELHEWIESIRNGVANRKNGAIVLLDDDRKPVVRWRFVNAFPRKWEGPNLDAKGSDVAIETLTLCCEGLERD
jgi:phage tail-like protein